jgi:resuscitation-promoting factor RpfB
LYLLDPQLESKCLFMKPSTKQKKVVNTQAPKRLSFQRNHPFVVPVITLFGLLIISMFSFLMLGGQTVGASDSKTVQLYVDGKTRTIPTRASTVREMLERVEIELAQEDVVEPSLDTPIISEKFSVNIYRARQVTVVDEQGKKTLAKTAETAPDQMARKAGYNLYPEDKVVVETPDQSLRDGVIGAKVVIDRATPIKINLYGTTYDVRTHAKTVADLAKERGIDFTNSSVLPAPETALREHELVFVTDPGKQIISVEEVIPNEVETINDQGLTVGTNEVRAEGSQGRKAVVYEITPDGKRKPLQEIVVATPVKRVIVKGVKSKTPNTSVAGDKASLMAQAGIAASQHSSADFIISRESGWRPAARNARNCIGLGQKCNAASLISQCPNWETDPVCQLRHFNGYAVGRYGSWDKAYTFWTVNHWW